MTMLSVASLIIAVLAVLIGFALGLRKIGVVSLPGPIENLLGISSAPADDVTVHPDDSPLLSLLENEYESTAQGLKVTEDEYLALLDETDALTEYSAILNVTVYGEGATSNKRHHIWRMGQSYRAETYDNLTGKLESILVCDGMKVSFTDMLNPDEPAVRVSTASGGFTLENQIGIPSVTDFLNRDDIENLVIRIIRSSANNLYYVTYNYIGHSQVEELYISLEHRLILRAISYALNDSAETEKVYSLDTVSLIDGNLDSYGNPELLFVVE